eukprot:GHVH01013771.1.p1 GENE.GHVH01013771.1~~GHVH01013771.1.p1  ORF type:complete len:100 (-),score=1.11 GHVH01013771.1:5-304(-)
MSSSVFLLLLKSSKLIQFASLYYTEVEMINRRSKPYMLHPSSPICTFFITSRLIQFASRYYYWNPIQFLLVSSSSPHDKFDLQLGKFQGCKSNLKLHDS